MATKVIEWDGSQLPKALKELPPGRYAIESIDQGLPLTAQEEQGIVEALAAIDAGEGIPLADVVRGIRGGLPR